MTEHVPIPARMRHLPRDVAGRPIPWFVAVIDGTPDPRIGDPVKLVQALRFRACWVCGQTVGRHAAFVLGPMCAVNRVTAEPGSHLECAVYSARACPFLSTPSMRRRPRGITPGQDDVAPTRGAMITRNPGVCAVWVTSRWEAFKAPGGPLISLGDPEQLLWFHQGRPATPEQARAAFESGLPILQAACADDDDPQASRAELDREIAAARKLLPA